MDIHKFKFPGFSTLLKLGSGKYETKVTFNDKKTNKEVGCLIVNNESKVLMK